MAEVYRQGDMIFRMVPNLPKGERLQLSDRETDLKSTRWETRGGSGHAHTLLDVQTFTINTIPFVIIPAGGAVIIHPEHPPMMLPSGIFSVDRVRTDELLPFVD